MTETRATYQATPADLRDFTPRIRAILQNHVGRTHQITARDLATALGLYGKYDDRRVRTIITKMIHAGEFIGSSPHKPAGYWMIANQAEARECLVNLRNRSISIMRRYKFISDLAYHKFGIPVEQLKMEF